MSRCQSRSGSRPMSARPSQVMCNNTQVPPATARPYTPGCRPGCTACCCPAEPLQKCPVGIYVERVKSLKPHLQFVPSCAKMDGMSTYREFFYPKCTEKTKSYKTGNNFSPSCAKFDGLTTYREGFYPKCVERVKSLKPSYNFDPSCAKMDGLTTYRQDFIPVCTEKVKSLKPSFVFDPSCAKMEGLTTYRETYIPYCPRELGKVVHTNNAPVDFSCAPFEGMSTYRGEYFPKPIVKTPSLKPTVRGAFSDAPFADRTTYRNDFFPFHFTKDCDRCVPQCFNHPPPPQCWTGHLDDGQQQIPLPIQRQESRHGQGEGMQDCCQPQQSQGMDRQQSQQNFHQEECHDCHGQQGSSNSRGGTSCGNVTSGCGDQVFLPQAQFTVCQTNDTTESQIE